METESPTSPRKVRGVDRSRLGFLKRESGRIFPRLCVSPKHLLLGNAEQRFEPGKPLGRNRWWHGLDGLSKVVVKPRPVTRLQNVGLYVVLDRDLYVKSETGREMQVWAVPLSSMRLPFGRKYCPNRKPGKKTPGPLGSIFTPKIENLGNFALVSCRKSGMRSSLGRHAEAHITSCKALQCDASRISGSVIESEKSWWTEEVNLGIGAPRLIGGVWWGVNSIGA